MGAEFSLAAFEQMIWCEQHDAHVDAWHEFEERAAIMEFDGGMEREEAEIETIESMRSGRYNSTSYVC